MNATRKTGVAVEPIKVTNQQINSLHRGNIRCHGMVSLGDNARGEVEQYRADDANANFSPKEERA